MYENILTQTGLSANEALIYEFLLQNNEIRASEIAKKTDLKRGLVYNLLADLSEKGLVERVEPAGKVAVFVANHPTKLRDYVNQKEKEVNSAKTAIDGILPNLLSSFNLSAGKPGVRFFEGIEGIRQVWWDSLETDEEIYTFGDLEAVRQNYAELNANYLKERKKRGIRKKFITNDNPANRKFMVDYDATLTEYRMIKDVPMDFSDVLVQIYKNKISYTTLSRDTMIGVIIEDKLIYEMQKNLFLALWQILAKQALDKPKSMYDMTA